MPVGEFPRFGATRGKFRMVELQKVSEGVLEDKLDADRSSWKNKKQPREGERLGIENNLYGSVHAELNAGGALALIESTKSYEGIRTLNLFGRKQNF